MNASRAQLTLLLTATLWSSGGVLIKSSALPALAVGGLRSFVAALFLSFIFGFRLPSMRVSFLAASFTFAGTVLLFTLATKLTTAANAIFLQSTAPLYVAILSPWFLHEKLKRLDIYCLFGVLLGMGLFFKEGLSSPQLLGDSVAALSGIFFALFILITKKSGPSITRDAVLWGNGLAALAAVPFMNKIVSAHSWDLAQVAFLGVFQLALPYWFYSRAIHFLPAFHGTLILLLEPILNPLWVYLFLDEVPSPWALLGGALVIASVTIRSLRRAI